MTKRQTADAMRKLAAKNKKKLTARQKVPVSATNPAYYRSHPSGVECTVITRHFCFNIGSVIKYLWRAGLKSTADIEDLKKARWYLDDEIALREGLQKENEK